MDPRFHVTGNIERSPFHFLVSHNEEVISQCMSFLRSNSFAVMMADELDLSVNFGPAQRVRAQARSWRSKMEVCMHAAATAWALGVPRAPYPGTIALVALDDDQEMVLHGMNRNEIFQGCIEQYRLKNLGEHRIGEILLSVNFEPLPRSLEHGGYFWRNESSVCTSIVSAIP